MDQALLDLVAQVKTTADEIKKTSPTRAEFDEKLKKLADDFGAMKTALEKDVSRAQGTVQPDLAIKCLRDMDVKSIADLKGLPVLKKGPFGEQTRELAVHPSVVDVLDMADQVHMLEALIATQYRKTDRWSQMKIKLGERDAIKAHLTNKGKVKGAAWNLFERWDKFTQDLTKALSSTAATAGDEWVPTNFGSNLLEQVRTGIPMVGLFTTVQMTSNPWTNPVQSTVGQCRIRTENTAVTESTMATANRSWTAYPFANYQAWSDEVDEDSVIAVMPAIRADITRSLGEGLEMAIVNADSDGANHIDDDYDSDILGAGYPQNAAFDGIRHFILDRTTKNTVSGTGTGFLTYALVAQGLGTMGKFGAHRTGDCVLAVNNETFLKLITESGSPIVTIDKYGAAATILTGELARIFGASVMTSHGVEQRRNIVATTGTNDGSGNTFSTALLFNRMNWRLGDRRDVRFESDKDITAGKNQMVATARWAFQAIEQHATDSTNLPAGVAFININ